MLITIAICTFDRADSLRRALESLVAMKVLSGLDWEVLVVNNNCTDHTDAVVASFADRLPIRRAFEPERGLSSARNRAIDVASGDYIVWTDDDVVVDPGWLAAYADAFGRWPRAAVFGGPITPRYHPPIPKWLATAGAVVNGVYGMHQLGDTPAPLSIADRRIPFGANYAVRAVEQRSNRYDTRLGVRPGRRLGSDEVDSIERILKAGAVGYWVPEAQVEHCIRADMQTLPYIARYFAGVGETDALLSGEGERGAAWFGMPRWVLRELIEEWVRYRIHRLISPSAVWLLHLRQHAYARGAARYYWHTAGGRAGTPKPIPSPPR